MSTLRHQWLNSAWDSLSAKCDERPEDGPIHCSDLFGRMGWEGGGRGVASGSGVQGSVHQPLFGREIPIGQTGGSRTCPIDPNPPGSHFIDPARIRRAVSPWCISGEFRDCHDRAGPIERVRGQPVADVRPQRKVQI